MREVIYTPDSQLNNIGKLLRTMLSDLVLSKELSWRLFVRNISALYRKTVFGYLWAFLPPIIITITFVFLNNQKIINVGEIEVPYPVYVMIGTVLWQLFFDALFSPIKAVNSSINLLAKSNFPREALIISGVLEVIFNFLIRLLLCLGLMLIYDIEFSFTLYLAPLGILSLFVFGLMLGMFLTPIAFLYQDVEKSLLIINSFWFFLTPVIYPVPTSGVALILVKYNPVTTLLVNTREWMLSGLSTNIVLFCFITLASLIFLVIAWIFYRLAMPHLISRIGS